MHLWVSVPDSLSNLNIDPSGYHVLIIVEVVISRISVYGDFDTEQRIAFCLLHAYLLASAGIDLWQLYIDIIF